MNKQFWIIWVLIHVPFVVPALLFFVLSKNRRLVMADIKARERLRPYIKSKNILWGIAKALIKERDYRSQFYMRLGNYSRYISWILPGVECECGYSKNIGPGFCLIHGFSVVINTGCKIGENCTILHNVTIGSGNCIGVPEIGDNCYIGAGAIIIGNVKIGNNVKIGAGAVVVNDVPDNKTIVGPKAGIL